MVSNVEPEAGLTIQSERETCDLHQLRSSLHGCSFRLEGMVKSRSVTEESGVKVEESWRFVRQRKGTLLEYGNRELSATIHDRAEARLDSSLLLLKEISELSFDEERLCSEFAELLQESCCFSPKVKSAPDRSVLASSSMPRGLRPSARPRRMRNPHRPGHQRRVHQGGSRWRPLHTIQIGGPSGHATPPERLASFVSTQDSHQLNRLRNSVRLRNVCLGLARLLRRGSQNAVRNSCNDTIPLIAA